MRHQAELQAKACCEVTVAWRGRVRLVLRGVAQGFVRVLDSARRSDSDAAAVWRDRSEDRLQGCRRLDEWLKRDGVLADGWTVGSAADLIWAIASVQMNDELVNERGWRPSRFTRHIQETSAERLWRLEKCCS